jgi:hypothetical protein
MVRKKAESGSSDDQPDVNVDDPAAAFDDNQAFKVFRVERIDGRSSLAYLDTIYGFDHDVLKERFGGGKYQIRPIDTSRRFIPGSFTVDISTSANPESDVNPDDSILSIEKTDPMLEYLIAQNRDLQAKLESLTQGKASKAVFSPDSMREMIDVILEKKAIIKGMKPLFDALDGESRSPDLDIMKMFKMFTDVLKEGVNLGQGVEFREPQERGVVGIIERFLPQLFQVLSAKKAAPVAGLAAHNPTVPPGNVPQISESNVVFPGSASEGDVYMFDLPQRIERAIMALVRCLESELDLSDDQIVIEYLRPILRPQDIKAIGDNLTYENIVSILTERGLSEEKLILAENETRVKAIIGLMIGSPKGSDTDTRPGKADNQSQSG